MYLYEAKNEPHSRCHQTVMPRCRNWTSCSGESQWLLSSGVGESGGYVDRELVRLRISLLRRITLAPSEEEGNGRGVIPAAAAAACFRGRYRASRASSRVLTLKYVPKLLNRPQFSGCPAWWVLRTHSLTWTTFGAPPRKALGACFR